jgi:hypothetical protein
MAAIHADKAMKEHWNLLGLGLGGMFTDSRSVVSSERVKPPNQS